MLRSLFPVGEDESVNLADLDTSLVPLARIPVGDSGLSASLDVSTVGEDRLGGMDLPVGVIHGASDGVVLVVISIMDINVLGVGDARGGVGDSLGAVFSEDSLNLRPFLGLNVGNEGVGIVGNLLVGNEALVDEGADIGSGETHENTSLEVGGGSGGNGSVLGNEHSVGSSGEHSIVK